MENNGVKLKRLSSKVFVILKLLHTKFIKNMVIYEI